MAASVSCEGSNGALGRVVISLTHGHKKPSVGHYRRPARILAEKLRQKIVERLGVSMPLQFNRSARNLCDNVVRRNFQDTIEGCNCVGITIKVLIADRDLIEDRVISRIQLKSALQVVGGLLPLSLPPVDVTEDDKRPRIVRQFVADVGKLAACAVIIEIGKVAVLRLRQMSFAGIGTQLFKCANGGLRFFQPFDGMIGSFKINLVVRVRELEIGKRK